MLRDPDDLVRLLQGMTPARYAAFLALQRAAARRCYDLGVADDPIARLLDAQAAPPVAKAAPASTVAAALANADEDVADLGDSDTNLSDLGDSDDTVT